MSRNAIVASLCFLALASCAGQSQYLAGQDLTQAIVGRKFAAATSRGIPFTIKFDSGGTGTVTLAGTARPLTWTIDGDVLCFGTVVNGQTHSECDRVHPAGVEYQFIDSTTGTLNNTYTPL
jgi:hypothetical protein